MLKGLLPAVALLSLTPLAGLAADSCGKAYDNGKDIESLMRCRSEAEAGNAEAELGYALILWSGHNQENDKSEALKWFRKSARQGHWLAQLALGTFLSHEKAPAEFRNRPEGYAWYITAGDTEAADRVRAQLSPAEIRKAEKMAEEYKAKYVK